MSEKRTAEFKIACENYFLTLSLNALRAYGRALKLQNPTEKKKIDLIKELVGVLCGEIVPRRKTTGAPAKNDYVEPKIFQAVAQLKKQYLGEIAPEEEAEPNDEHAAAPAAEEKESANKPVSLHFDISPASLTVKQKRLLNDFLNSL